MPEGKDGIAGGQAARCDNVATLTVSVLQQGDVRRAVRIVLDALDAAGDSVLVALEVDHAVMVLVPASAVTRRDPSGVVATTRLGFLFHQGRMRRTLVQVRMLDLDDTPAPWRCWFCLNDCHDYSSLN